VAATRGQTTATVHTKGISLNTIISHPRVPTNRRIAATVLLGSPSCMHLHKKSLANRLHRISSCISLMSYLGRTTAATYDSYSLAVIDRYDLAIAGMSS
jgi:hypothetical protein